MIELKWTNKMQLNICMTCHYDVSWRHIKAKKAYIGSTFSNLFPQFLQFVHLQFITFINYSLFKSLYLPTSKLEKTQVIFITMSAKVRRAVATVNNYTESGYEGLKTWAVENCKYAVIGKEKGEEGTPHLQCFFVLKKNPRLSALTKQIEAATGKHPWTDKANGTNDEAADYCKKDGVFWEHGVYAKKAGERTDIQAFFNAVKRGADDTILAAEFPKEFAKYHAASTKLKAAHKHVNNKEKIKKKFLEKPLRKWQKHALNLLEKQDDRKVLWIHDPTGNLGKSFLGNWMLANMEAFLVEGGKNADIGYAYNYEPYVIFDYTRCQEERVNYAVIESFKNGRLFAPKYESKLKVFESAKVICFSNFDPDREKLSQDRWQVVTYEGPHKRTWLELEAIKPQLKRTYCQAQALPDGTPPLSEDDDDEPPKKRMRMTPSPKEYCDQCASHNCNVH